MSDQNWPPANPQGDGANPPEDTTPESAGSPSYEPPAPGGYPPPDGAEPGGYVPPVPGADTPPAPGGYTPPAPDGSTPPGAPTPGGFDLPPEPAVGSYGVPPPPSPYGAGYPEQPSYPPADPYAQQPGAYPPADPYAQQPGAYPPPPGYPATPPVGASPSPTLGGVPLADWPKRALGGLIDYIAPSIVISIVLSVIPGDGLRGTLSSLLGLAWWAYLGYKSGTTGVTIGRSIAKTKLVSEETGQPIGVANGIIRQVAHIIDTAICFVGWLFPLWDTKRQTIADKLVKTVVLDNSADPNAGKYTWWP